VARQKSVKNWRPGNPEETFAGEIGIPTDPYWWGLHPVFAKEAAEEMRYQVLSEFPGVTVYLAANPVSDGPDAAMIDEWVGAMAERVVNRIRAER
jgi:hypothetical protein